MTIQKFNVLLSVAFEMPQSKCAILAGQLSSYEFQGVLLNPSRPGHLYRLCLVPIHVHWLICNPIIINVICVVYVNERNTK